MIRFLIFVAIFIAMALPSFAQVSSIEPAQPKWGDQIIISYDPQQQNARLSASDKIFVKVWLSFSDHSFKSILAKMERTDGKFRYRFTLPKESAFLSVYFITLDNWDALATAHSMIYRPDGVLPKTAYEHKMGNLDSLQSFLNSFELERRLYPDNYAVYRTKWFQAAFLMPDSVAAMISSDLQFLTQVKADSSVEWLYALSDGLMRMDDEPQARQVLKSMMRLYPEHTLTCHAIGHYEYHVFTKQLTGQGPDEIKKCKWNLIQKYPSVEFARKEAFKNLGGQMDVPLQLIEKLCQLWIKAEPENPNPYFNLGVAYHKRDKKLEAGLTNIEKAIELTLAGKGRLYDDMSGNIEKFILPSMYEILAELEMKQQNWSRALAAIKAAQNLTKETNEQLSRLEASLWLRLERFSQAEQTYQHAWEKGSKIAEDSLKSLYQRKHGDLAGFENYIQQKMTSSQKAKEKKETAPEFSVTTIDNKIFNSTSLRGKVVVLNFWYVGCGPCHVEIPSLNKLVEEYQGKAIEFIAVALTDKARLESFLKKNPFNYHIIPDGEAIAKKFGVKFYPTHIIIDQESNIAYTASGGRPNIHENLKPMIDRLLP